MALFGTNLLGEAQLTRALGLTPNASSPYKYGRFRNLSGVAIAPPFTLSGWFKLDALPTADNNLFATYSSASIYTDLRVRPGSVGGTWQLLTFSRGAGSSGTIGSTDQPGASATAWHFVALVVNSAGVGRLWIDGVGNNTQASYGTLLPTSFWPIAALGNQNGNNLSPFKGAMARWSWLNKELKERELKRIYNEGHGSDYLYTRYKPTDFLWRLPLADEAIAVGSPAVLLDNSGNSRHLDLFPNSTGSTSTAGNVTAATPQVAAL